jgi:hypothetical protein
MNTRVIAYVLKAQLIYLSNWLACAAGKCEIQNKVKKESAPMGI